MAVSHSATLIDQGMLAMQAALDGAVLVIQGATTAATIQLLTSADVVLAHGPAPVPMFETPLGGSSNANPINPIEVSTGGVIAKGKVVSADLEYEMYFSVGETGSGADCIISESTVIAGQFVNITSLVYNGAS